MRRRDFAFMLGAVALTACSRQAEEKTETPPATPGADPAATIRPLYDRYLTPNATFPDFEHQAPWSRDLWAQLSAMSARSQAINEPILDFDPLIDAQDYELSNLNVSNDSVAPNSHAVVRASFVNGARATEVVYDLIWEDDAWKIDNMRSGSWNLRQIAAAPNADAMNP
jgi:hypothetical protein